MDLTKNDSTEYASYLDKLRSQKVRIPFKGMDRELLALWQKIPDHDEHGKEKSIFFDGKRYFGGYYRNYSSPEGRANGVDLEEAILCLYNWVQALN